MARKIRVQYPGAIYHVMNRGDPLYLQEPAQRPGWLRVDRLLGEWGIPKDSPAGREQFAGQMEARRRAEGQGEPELDGWCLGSEEFRQELLAQVSELASPRHAGEEIRQSALRSKKKSAKGHGHLTIFQEHGSSWTAGLELLDHWASIGAPPEIGRPPVRTFVASPKQYPDSGEPRKSRGQVGRLRKDM